jgi:hypothetical protein
MGEFCKKERVFWEVFGKLTDIAPVIHSKPLEEVCLIAYYFIQLSDRVDDSERELIGEMSLNEIRVRLSCYLRIAA